MTRVSAMGVSLIAAVIVTGCSHEPVVAPVRVAVDAMTNPKTVDLSNSTDTIRRQYYSSWPKPIQQAVDHHVVLVGMDKLQVQVSMHIPENAIKKEQLKDANGDAEIWLVWHYPGGWSQTKEGDAEVRIRFQDDKVVGIFRAK